MVRPAGGPRPTAYATSAVAGTLLSLVALLAVSLAVARDDPSAPSGRVVAGPFNASPTASVRGAARQPAKRGTSRPSTPTGTEAAGAASAAAAPVSDGTALTADPSTASPTPIGHPNTAAAGNAAPADATADGATTMPVHPAKPGEWQLSVESRADGAVVVDATGDATLYADQPASDGADQHFVPHSRPLGALAASTVRTNNQGRSLVALELTGEPGRRLVPDAAVTEVPSSWHAGDRWTWRLVAEDQRTTLDATLTLVGRETMTLKDGKTQVDVVRIDQAMTLAGDRSVNVQRKVWFAPSLGVPVRIDEQVTGTDAAGRPINRQTTADLGSTEPSSGAIVPNQPPG